MVIEDLSIFFGKQTVGILQFDAGRNSFSIVYNADWIKKGFPLSPYLPFNKAHDQDAATRFLENLLPEGSGLTEIARTLKVSKDNIHALIVAIGKDATGAFTIGLIKQDIATSFREIPLKELKKRIKERARQPITIWDGKPRLSLAGIQEKIALTIKDGIYGLGEGNLASTHILKFGNKKTPHIVLNEFFCMRLIAQTSLPVANVELVNLSERVLHVERFDRGWIGPEEVSRFHIIDGCQALDLIPAYKYEKFLGRGQSTDDILGPANLKNIYSFAKACKVPAKAQLTTLQWVIANLIIGNCDHHVKNISYFVDRNGLRVAPAYDLLNVSMYPEFDQELAFEIGGTFDLQEIDANHFVAMAHELKLTPRFVATQLKKISNEILKAIPEILFEDVSDQEAKFLQRLRNDIAKRAKFYLNEADKLPLVGQD